MRPAAFRRRPCHPLEFQYSSFDNGSEAFQEGSLPMSIPHGSDHRVYLLRREFQAAVVTSDALKYCHRAESLEGGFHLIAEGEVYLHSDDVAYCLNCAIHQGIATAERPNLDRGNRIAPNPTPE